MERRSVELEIAGRNVRVVSSAPPDELKRLAALVDARVSGMAPRGRPHPEALLLAAISLAHDLEDERSRRATLERRTRDVLRRVILRLDEALEPAESPDQDEE
jgi:cell division protein ZapA